MVDVVGNMSLVWSFCGLGREHNRLDATIDREMSARRRSLLYLEKLRLFHAAVTVILTIALLAWAIVLWQNGIATAGDVVLVCTLGLSILHATRDLAVALVDVTQHLARLSEALATLLVRIACGTIRRRRRWRDRARPWRSRMSCSAIPTGERCLPISACELVQASALVLSVSPAAAKSTLFGCCSVFTMCRADGS